MASAVGENQEVKELRQHLPQHFGNLNECFSHRVIRR
jgi:hypothetical protein